MYLNAFIEYEKKADWKIKSLVSLSNYGSFKFYLGQQCIEIYNRWGDLLFRFYGSGSEYADPQNRWKGKYNGVDLPMGPYLFIIDLHDNKKPITGTITIVR